MSVKQRLIDKAEIYIVSAILAPLALGGFYAMMDARHEKVGEVKKSEVRLLKRELREKTTYQQLAPSDTYSAAREAEMLNLRDDIEELEKEIPKS